MLQKAETVAKDMRSFIDDKNLLKESVYRGLRGEAVVAFQGASFLTMLPNILPPPPPHVPAWCVPGAIRAVLAGGRDRISCSVNQGGRKPR